VESHHQNTVIMRALARMDTSGRAVEEVLSLAQQGLAQGCFRLAW
jgi:hypothetical protein